MRTTEQYLQTLRRIPDDVVLSMATRDLDLDWGSRCICGWAFRESLARAAEKDAGEVGVPTSASSGCHGAFGGEFSEWNDIYWGVTHSDTAGLIEEAFVLRVMEAAGVAA